MPDAQAYFDRIDAARIRRALELSECKQIFQQSIGDAWGVRSKALIVLAYAHWEGFYNECVDTYIDYLTDAKVPVSRTNWLLLVGAMSSDFNALRDRQHSADARRFFVEALQKRIECDFSAFDRSTIKSRSNLDFAKLAGNLTLLGFDFSRLQPDRIRLDKELVGWRHGVAHGSSPDLSSVDVASHVEFTGQLMLTTSDLFQEAIAGHEAPA